MKVMLTGAEGFVAQHLIPTLLQEHHQILATVYSPFPGQKLSDHVSVMQADIRDQSALEKAITDFQPEAVIHLAAVSFVPLANEKPDFTLDVNFHSSLKFMRLCQKHCPHCHFIFPSTAQVYGPVPAECLPIKEEQSFDPRNAYALSKACAELALRLEASKTPDFKLTVLRLFNHCGPGQDEHFVLPSFVNQALTLTSKDQLEVGDLDQARDFLDVRDVVEVYAAAVRGDLPPNIYNVCSGRAQSIRDLLDMVIEEAEFQGQVVSTAQRQRQETQRDLVGDASRLKQAMGFEPRYDIRQSIRDVIQETKDRKAQQEGSL